MKLEQHQEEVKKLKKLEAELTTLILEKNDPELNTKFYKWQDQRNYCNKGFVEFMDEALK